MQHDQKKIGTAECKRKGKRKGLISIHRAIQRHFSQAGEQKMIFKQQIQKVAKNKSNNDQSATKIRKGRN